MTFEFSMKTGMGECESLVGINRRNRLVQCRERGRELHKAGVDGKKERLSIAVLTTRAF